MAIYHLSVKTVSRSAGRSATGAAAYRSGERIVDERTGEIHDYTRKGGVLFSEIVTPADAPEWASDRSALWNAAEQAETRKNSTVAREFIVALPAELSAGDRIKLAQDLAREIAERHGCAVDVAIHAPGKEGDARNHHAHLLCTTRRLGREGFTEKTRELDDQKSGAVTAWRERWAELQNERLAERGKEARVDHRSLKDQGITDREPGQHLGPAVIAIERRTGQKSDVRLRQEQEAMERLASAKVAGELERQAAQIDRSIIDTRTELAVALADRSREREQAAKDMQLFMAAAGLTPDVDVKALKEEGREVDLPTHNRPPQILTTPDLPRETVEDYIRQRQAVNDNLVKQGDKALEYRQPRPGETVVGVVKGVKTIDGQQYALIDAGPNRDRTAQQVVVVKDSAAIRSGQRYKAREIEGRMERDRSMEPPGKSRGR